ncbi:MAG: hypothetical protein ACE5LC_05725 [Candidatus Aminicenantales bacterium]
MKSSVVFWTVVILFLFPLISAEQEQLQEWKGKIETENGIKVIKNPREPLYGDITFELDEDLSIGREDDENYIFFKVVRVEADSEGNIQ